MLIRLHLKLVKCSRLQSSDLCPPSATLHVHIRWVSLLPRAHFPYYDVVTTEGFVTLNVFPRHFNGVFDNVAADISRRDKRFIDGKFI